MVFFSGWFAFWCTQGSALTTKIKCVTLSFLQLFEVTQEGHLIWSLPLSITLVTIFLVLIMGPVTLVGIAILIATVPVVERITNRMLKIRHARVSWTDKRVGIVNAMLQGVRRVSSCQV
jgi:hypothetical protein